MIKTSRSTAITALIFAACGAGGAAAAPLRFSVNGTRFVGSWISDSQPAPFYADPHAGLVLSLDIGRRGAAANATFAVFYQAGNPDWNIDGRTLMTIYFANSAPINFTTPGQVYSGYETAPTFSPGTYALAPWQRDPASSLAGTLTIGPAAPVPIAGRGELAALAALAGFAFTRAQRLRLHFPRYPI